MKISDILSATQIGEMRSVATAKTSAEKYAPTLQPVHEHLYTFADKHKCVLDVRFWCTLSTEYATSADVVVCINAGNAEVFPVRKTRLFAHHLGEKLKGGCAICRVINGKTMVVNWDNWKETYARLTSSADKREYDLQLSGAQKRKMRIDAERERMFDGAAQCNRYKKMGKRGFNLAFNEMRANDRLVAYEREIYATLKSAKNILNICEY